MQPKRRFTALTDQRHIPPLTGGVLQVQAARSPKRETIGNRIMRGMETVLVKGAVLLGMTIGVCTGAFGPAGITLTTVDPLSPTVTYSRPADLPRIAALTTFVGAKVTVVNTSGNTINKVV